MPALNYRKGFALLVETGQKRQTIRLWRKRPFQVGDRLYHYTGMRTKACRKLLESTCIEATPIMIDGVCVCIDSGIPLTAYERDELARADGFNSYAEMEAWFEAVYTMPVKGQLIRW